VRFIGTDQEGMVFLLEPQEHEELIRVLRLYPRTPAAYHRASRTDPATLGADPQAILDAAMTEHRAASQTELTLYLAAPDVFTKEKKGVRWRLAAGKREWILQVLNDVRVGLWIEAGCPARLESVSGGLGREAIQRAWLMEAAGFFQMRILEAVHGRGRHRGGEAG
jgi:hypothetical protein